MLAGYPHPSAWQRTMERIEQALAGMPWLGDITPLMIVRLQREWGMPWERIRAEIPWEDCLDTWQVMGLEAEAERARIEAAQKTSRHR